MPVRPRDVQHFRAMVWALHDLGSPGVGLPGTALRPEPVLGAIGRERHPRLRQAGLAIDRTDVERVEGKPGGSPAGVGQPQGELAVGHLHAVGQPQELPGRADRKAQGAAACGRKSACSQGARSGQKPTVKPRPTPKGLDRAHVVQPLRGRCRLWPRFPGCAGATLGCGIQPLQGKKAPASRGLPQTTGPLFMH